MTIDPYKSKEVFERWLSSIEGKKEIEGLNEIHSHLLVSIIKNYEEIIRKSNQLIDLLSEYELLVNLIPKYSGIEAIEEVNKMIQEGKSNKDLKKFISENTDRVSNSLSTEKALYELKRVLSKPNKGEIINPLNYKEDFKELSDKIMNFLLTGNSDASFSGKFPIAGYPVMLIRTFNIRYALYDFIDSIKKNIDFE